MVTGDCMEELISPCDCMGSMSVVHVCCLEKWLSTSNLDRCEVCKFQFKVQRTPRPIIQVGAKLCFFYEVSCANSGCTLKVQFKLGQVDRDCFKFMFLIWHLLDYNLEIPRYYCRHWCVNFIQPLTTFTLNALMFEAIELTPEIINTKL